MGPLRVVEALIAPRPSAGWITRLGVGPRAINMIQDFPFHGYAGMGTFRQ